MTPAVLSAVPQDVRKRALFVVPLPHLVSAPRTGYTSRELPGALTSSKSDKKELSL